MSDSQKLSIQVDSDHSMGDSIPSPPSNTWLAILPSQDLIPSNVIGTNLSIPVSQIYAKNQSQKFRDQNFSFDQVEIFANQTKEICLHLQSTIKDHQTRENNLFIENQGLKEHVKKIEFELNAEKIKYNQMVCEGVSKISSLSCDNKSTKNNLEVLKQNINDKDNVICQLTDQIGKLSISSASEKSAVIKRSTNLETELVNEREQWISDRQNLLVQNEQKDNKISNLQTSLKELHVQYSIKEQENDSLLLQNKNLKSDLDTKSQ